MPGKLDLKERVTSTRILDSSCEGDLAHLGAVIAPQGVTSQIGRGDQKGPSAGKPIDDAHAFNCFILVSGGSTWGRGLG
jgi:hypothetical protein